MSTVCAVVVSLPERHELLKEALDSVAGQTLKPNGDRRVDDIVVGVDSRHYGEAGNMNRLIRATDCEWLAFLHDDDVWLPNHIEVAERHFETADVIVAKVTLVGREHIEAQHDNFGDLRFTNWFPPSAVIARKSVFGEWIDKTPDKCWVDWANWNRLLDAGARFVHTNEATFLYRFGDWDNGSFRSATAQQAPGWELTGK